MGQVGGLEEDLATHHYERISTAVTCGDEHRWPVVDSSSSLLIRGMVQVPQRAVSGPGHVVRWQLRLRGPGRRGGVRPGAGVDTSASKSSIRRFVITEKAPTRAFSWLKAATTTFTFKTLLRHYAKRALTPRSLNVKLGPLRKGHKGRAGWLA